MLSPNRYRRMFQKVGVFEVGGMDGGALKRLEAREIRIKEIASLLQTKYMCVRMSAYALHTHTRIYTFTHTFTH